jgi:DNA-binding HxlR family transcriptional regulator
VSPSLLNNRLKELRGTGLVALGPDGYHLTALGEELLLLLKQMGTWSTHWAQAIR